MGKYMFVVATLFAAYAYAELDGSYILPRDHAAIQYGAAEGKDRVARSSRNCARESSVWNSTSITVIFQRC